MPKTEFRYAEFRRLRDEGVTGPVIRYGVVARFGDFRERFEPGSLAIGDDLICNLQHDRTSPVARTGGAGLEVTADGDAVRAAIEWPDTRYGRSARELVVAGILRGFSLEFRCRQERWEGRERVIVAADMIGLALVDKPAYPDSTIALRMAKEVPVKRHAKRTRYFV